MKDLRGALRRWPMVRWAGSRATTRLSLALAALVALPACSPTYNWREQRVDRTPLQALLPCKPEQGERPVPLAGAETTLHMLSCETGGMTYALAWAEMDAATPAAATLATWRDASLRAIRATTAAEPAQDVAPHQVKGATVTLTVAAQGVDHRGRALQTRAVYFARGTQVYQAAVYGERLPDEAVTPYFDGLHFP